MSDHWLSYRARCAKCDHVLKADSDPRWLKPFFLPADCAKCGAHLDRTPDFLGHSGSVLETSRHKRVSPPFNLFKPSTWEEKWETVTERRENYG